MSDRIILNHHQYEAAPFWPDRPFINPDKSGVKSSLPLIKNFRDRFDVGSLDVCHSISPAAQKLNINQLNPHSRVSLRDLA